ncbi:MAG: hypothetical protein JRJ02_12990 [Deltaproteobacteria bacterium]|nr:hypothetical protein [Deltaproteobacteria bacterium]
MIFMGTYTMPSNKTEEWWNCFSGFTEKPLPSCIKKWQTFSCLDGDGTKGYNLISVKEGKGDEGLIEISKLMGPFLQIEGASFKLEPLMGVTDSLKVLEKSK